VLKRAAGLAGERALTEQLGACGASQRCGDGGFHVCRTRLARQRLMSGLRPVFVLIVSGSVIHLEHGEASPSMRTASAHYQGPELARSDRWLKGS